MSSKVGWVLNQKLRREVMNEILTRIYYLYYNCSIILQGHRKDSHKAWKKHRRKNFFNDDAVYISFDVVFVSFVRIQVIQDEFGNAQWIVVFFLEEFGIFWKVHFPIVTQM